MILTSQKAIALKEHGYVQIPYEKHINYFIKTTMELWKKFHNQELSHKLKFVFGEEGGYEYKGPTDPDYKENFHISLSYNPDYPWMTNIDRDFICAAQKLIFESMNIALEVAGILDEGTDTFNVPGLTNESQNSWMLRLLHYPPRESKDLLAIPHIDKAVTIHLDEDAPGLQILWKNEWQSVEPMAGHVLAYPGMLGQYYSECEFPALCHRVQATEQTCLKGRNSIVLFVRFGDVVYDKGTFGKTQERFPNGENYDLSFLEFEKFFTDLENKVL